MEIVEIYELAGICALPINPLDAAKVLGIKVVSYETMCGYYRMNRDSLYQKSIYGFCFSECNRFIIAVNENSCGERRRRFTVAHELGHCVLGHLDGTKNHLNDERDANRFAADFLAPLCVLEQCGVCSAEEISRLCGISVSAAGVRFAELKSGTFARDNRITERFAGFISRYNESKLPHTNF